MNEPWKIVEGEIGNADRALQAANRRANPSHYAPGRFAVSLDDLDACRRYLRDAQAATVSALEVLAAWRNEREAADPQESEGGG